MTTEIVLDPLKHYDVYVEHDRRRPAEAVGVDAHEIGPYRPPKQDAAAARARRSVSSAVATVRGDRRAPLTRAPRAAARSASTASRTTAAGDVVVDDPRRLHQRVRRRRADEAKAAPLELARERLGLGRRRPACRRASPARGAVGRPARRTTAARSASRPPRCSATVARALAIVASILPRWRMIPASPSSRCTSSSPKRRDRRRLEAAEDLAKARALAQDRDPRQARLKALEAQPLEQQRGRRAPAAPTPRRGRRCRAGRSSASSERPPRQPRIRSASTRSEYVRPGTGPPSSTTMLAPNATAPRPWRGVGSGGSERQRRRRGS